MVWSDADFRAWLVPVTTGDDPYWHSRLSEDDEARAAGYAALRRLASRAHADAQSRLDRAFEPTLDPTGEGARPGYAEYPERLHTTVLQGYLGELLAGLIAENHNPHGRAWIVPAFLFRGHAAAFQELVRQRQLGRPPRPIPGRTGDDALAFEIDDDDHITAWLWIEAKCTHRHRSSLVGDGHETLSEEIVVPVDLMQLIEILGDSANPDSARWIAGLRELFFSPSPAPRHDMLVYVCGKKPRRTGDWLPTDRPHRKYTRGGPLHAVEIHLDPFDDALGAAYPKHVIERD